MNQAFPGSQAGSNRFAVRVEAPARLHLGFIDVSGSLGRRFGSLGLTLEEFSTVLSLRRAERFDAQGPDAQRASDYLRRLLDDHDPSTSVALRVHQAIPEHVGLGSGTQLALAVGKAFSALFELPVSVAALAARLDRGARSGIGIGAFEEGGFVVDGGSGAAGAHPPVISRMPFPGSWRVLLVFDRAERGLFGEAERAAFRALQAFPQQRAAHLAHLVLMRLMPALVEEDFASFSGAIGEIQRAVGDYFAAAQGGRFASRAVAAGPGLARSEGHRRRGTDLLGPDRLRHRRLRGACAGVAARGARALRVAQRARVRSGAGAQSRAQPGGPERSAGPFLAARDAIATTPASRCPIDSLWEGGSSMEKPHILHLFTPAAQASPFDVNMAYDAGYQAVVPYTGMRVADVTTLTQDAIFSRGPKGVKRTGIFIGGRDLALALEMLDAAKRAMVPPFEVSVFVDPSGAFTTAAAAVAAVERLLEERPSAPRSPARTCWCWAVPGRSAPPPRSWRRRKVRECGSPAAAGWIVRRPRAGWCASATTWRWSRCWPMPARSRRCWPMRRW